MRFCYSIYEKWFDSREDGIIDMDNIADLSLALTEKCFQLMNKAGVPELLESSLSYSEDFNEENILDIMNESVDFCYWQVDESKSFNSSDEELENKISDNGLDDFVLHYCYAVLNPKI